MLVVSGCVWLSGVCLATGRADSLGSERRGCLCARRSARGVGEREGLVC